MGKSGSGGYVPPPQTKKLDLTVPTRTEEGKKQDTSTTPTRRTSPRSDQGRRRCADERAAEGLRKAQSEKLKFRTGDRAMAVKPLEDRVL
jgi:hypothetical protein